MTRMPLPDAPKTATIDDARTVGHTPASAFGDDPMTRWFFPDGASRETGLGRHFTTLITRQYGLHGVCKQTESAAAFWVSPEGADKAVPDAKTTQGLVEILGDRAPAFQEAVMAAAEHGPAEPHWYLAAIGADPAARGQGHGSRRPEHRHVAQEFLQQLRRRQLPRSRRPPPPHPRPRLQEPHRPHARLRSGGVGGVRRRGQVPCGGPMIFRPIRSASHFAWCSE
ncbi:hypothetical protein STANM309S_00940 [Streptomyces tanashiensis]